MGSTTGISDAALLRSLAEDVPDMASEVREQLRAIADKIAALRSEQANVGSIMVLSDAQIAEIAAEVGLPYGPETWPSLRSFAHHVQLNDTRSEQAPAGGWTALSDAEFLFKRLARVAELAGVQMPDFSHEGIAEVAGTILGAIARNLEHVGVQTAREQVAQEKVWIDQTPYFEGGRESVNDALEVVDSFGPGIRWMNDTFARQIILAAEVKRLRALYEQAVSGRSTFRDALRKARDAGLCRAETEQQAPADTVTMTRQQLNDFRARTIAETVDRLRMMQQAPAVPSGFKLVPSKMTPEMRWAASGELPFHMGKLDAAYEAALSAAPAAPQTKEPK